MAGVAWPKILRGSALAGVVAALLIMAYAERAIVPPLVIVSILLILGSVLLTRGHRAGVWVTTVAAGLFLVAGGLFYLPELVAPSSFGSFATGWIAVATAAVGVVSGIASWQQRPPSAAGRGVVVGAGAVAVVAVLGALIASLSFTDAHRAPDDVVIKATSSKFHPSRVTVAAGPQTFFIDNGDNTLHDFHIVGVKGGDKDVPANHQVHLAVNLAPGTYKYTCDLHSGMTGTLVVR
jgi:plastocyanin